MSKKHVMKFVPEFVKPEKNLCFLPNANCTKKQGMVMEIGQNL